MGPFDAVIHCASQPAHDWAAKEPLTDFAVNASGTVNMLEATRLYSPNAHFIFTSTSKVYGTVPNEKEFQEYDSRYDATGWMGFDESTRIDNTLHSLFGASKVAADIMAQEYGKYFGLKTTIFRPGCLTGPTHSAVELHGFLSYLVKCVVKNLPYTIYGYKGKQVRDNIHSYDVVRAFEEVIENPATAPGEVYNLGGGRGNSVSMTEAILKIKLMSGNLDFKAEYQEEPRIGDHKCWITDNSKFQRDYPYWSVTNDIDTMLEEMVEAEKKR
jgi:CDP-paratose 2-epimerase